MVHIANMTSLFMTLLFTLVGLSVTEELQSDSAEEYCLSEIFQPRCLKNEVILMRNATYGRMRIGRCITAEEVDGLGSRHLGCAANVLALLDRKCSGMTECDVRVVEISDHNVKPCFPGLNVYLEASYDCINTVDERRSCAVDVSTTPIHIIGSKTCGTKSHPWTAEAPVGQKINVSILNFPRHESDEKALNGKQSCSNYGAVFDRILKRNITICVAGDRREKIVYLSKGNILDIYLGISDTAGVNKFILKLEGVGCSDIIPPEDAYLKRNEEEIMVGCFMSRKTWHLLCVDGKWIGVIGNCSQGYSVQQDLVSEEELTSVGFSNETVVGMMALGGLTLAICLAIICFGIVCFRRVHLKAKKMDEYKTINCSNKSSGVQPILRGVHPTVATDFSGSGARGMAAQPMPTYSVFVGEDAELYNDTNHSSALNRNSVLSS